jgi:hypothetical protein
MHAQLAAYVSTCDRCQRNKASNQRPAGLLQPPEIPDEPLSHVSMDVVMALPLSSGFDAILVVIDKLSKSIVIIPNHTTVIAKKTARLYSTTFIAVMVSPARSSLTATCGFQSPSDSSPARKLEPKFAGLYKVTKCVSPVAYRLELPSGTNAHPAFHSSLLKAYKPDSTGERTAQVPEAASVDGQVEYVVDAILDDRVRRGKKEYLVY